MRSREGFVHFREFRTWYRVVGESREGRDPLVCLHGGPGSTHHYFTPLERLADGRAVVLYDQLGCGGSDRPTDLHWDLGVFVDELAAVRDQLQLPRIHLLGTSWGGMLALEHALSGYGGLASLVAELDAGEHRRVGGRGEASARRAPRRGRRGTRPLRGSRGVRRPRVPAGARGLRRPLRAPRSPRTAGARADARRARSRGLQRHGRPQRMDRHGRAPRVDVRGRLGEVAVPSLVVRGRHDLCTERIAATLLKGLPNAREVIFEESSHMPVLEETDRYLEAVGAFLQETEDTG